MVRTIVHNCIVFFERAQLVAHSSFGYSRTHTPEGFQGLGFCMAPHMISITRAAKPLKPCDEAHCSLSQSHGLPCRHKIYAIIAAEKHLRLWDVYPHWHLKNRLVSFHD